METRLLKAKGKGEYTYDYKNDLLLFRIKDRNYFRSFEFENFCIDLDEEGFITGMRISDASKIFRLLKMALLKLKNFEFNAQIENNVISVQLNFTCLLRNSIISHGQDFSRAVFDSRINDSRVIATIA